MSDQAAQRLLPGVVFLDPPARASAQGNRVQAEQGARGVHQALAAGLRAQHAGAGHDQFGQGGGMDADDRQAAGHGLQHRPGRKVS